MKLLKNRVVLGIVCIVLAAVLVFVGIPFVNNLSTAKTTVVRATQDIKMGTKLTQDMFEEVEVGSLNLPEDVAHHLTSVKGQFLTVNMTKGDYLTKAKIATTLTLPDNKITAMKPGQQALTVALNGAAQSYANKLLPNDIITVYSTADNNQSSIVNELTYVQVVMTTASDGTQILRDGQTDKDGKPLTPAYATFIVNDVQAKKLIGLQSKLYFVLRYRGTDATTINKYLDAQETALKNNTTVVNVDNVEPSKPNAENAVTASSSVSDSSSIATTSSN